MVVVEEGVGNVIFRAFQSAADAWSYYNNYNDLLQFRFFISRIIYDDKGNELKSGGWNPLALETIRREYRAHCVACSP